MTASLASSAFCNRFDRFLLLMIRFFVLALVLLLAPLSPALAAEVLRISAIPDQNPERLNRLYGLVAKELSDQLKVPVRYVPVIDYAAAVTGFRRGDLDLVWFGGLTGVQARLQTPGAVVLAQRDVDARFRSVFIANRAALNGVKPFSSIDGLKQLKGTRFSFGSESSTSGRLMPQHFLAKAGVKPSDFNGGQAGFSGSHDATIALVQSGAYQAGALNEQVWDSRVKEGKVNLNKVQLLWRTPTYPDYHWVAQGNLNKRFGAGFTKRLQRALFDLSPAKPRQAKILELFGAERFIAAPAGQYASIEAVGRELGKIR